MGEGFDNNAVLVYTILLHCHYNVLYLIIVHFRNSDFCLL